MITVSRLKYFFIIILFFSLVKTTHAEEKPGYDIKFANTFFVEHFSDMLYNNVRTEHKTIADKPSYYFNEKLQVFFTYSDPYQKDQPLTGCCIDLPSTLYASLNIIYSHYENYAISTGIQFEFGFGDYKNPFLSFGIGGIYQKDMVFQNTGNSNINWLFHMGCKHDMHFSVDIETKVFNGSRDDESERTYGTMELALGYKKYSNFFILFYLEDSESLSNFHNNENFEYSYDHFITFIHLQYYGNLYGISIGYTYNSEYYDKTIYNESKTVQLESAKLDYRKSHGGGLTFYANNSDSSAELFGEFHLLADKDMNWMTISKLGVKAYF